VKPSSDALKDVLREADESNDVTVSCQSTFQLVNTADDANVLW
jgi:hypothetical protein